MVLSLVNMDSRQAYFVEETSVAHIMSPSEQVLSSDICQRRAYRMAERPERCNYSERTSPGSPAECYLNLSSLMKIFQSRKLSVVQLYRRYPHAC